MPPSRVESELLAERETLEAALSRVRFFVEAEDREWIVRYPPEPGATLELVPLTVAPMARELLSDAADFVVLSSAYLGHRSALAESLGLEESAVRSVASDSPDDVITYLANIEESLRPANQSVGGIHPG